MNTSSLADTSQIVQSPVDTLVLDTLINSFSKPLIGGSVIDYISLSNSSGFIMSGYSFAWYFYLLMILLIAYAVARAFLGRLLSSTFTAAISYNNAVSLFNDNSQLQRQRDSVLYGFYFLSLGFFLMLISNLQNWRPYDLEGFSLFAFFTLLTFLVFYTRRIILNLIGHVFFSLTLFREYLYHGYSYNKLLGIVLIPLNFAIVYTNGIIQKIVVIISVSALISVIIMKIFRGLLFSYKHNVFNFYLFLYLCALEIVPIFLIYKWFKIIV